MRWRPRTCPSIRRSRLWIAFASACMADMIPHRGTDVLLHSTAVSSRQEEKQRRREERLARERAEKARAARQQRLRLAGGALAGVVVVVAAVLLVTGAIGGSSKGSEGDPAQPSSNADVKLPTQ